eukprot:TRINITY_DN6073_c1_g1_i1.p1 TRINITY_DN6073_c1_g1~~TRINITY_DN6073_c1_g1_i1.p1  ORF type:complete len:417 (-),score=36.73 TRINITY_DN6073_c1_g1_i1:53-1282(-)
MSSKVLVLNAGSSSLKFQLFDFVLKSGLVNAVGGLVERIGEENSRLVFKHTNSSNNDVSKHEVDTKVDDHTKGLKYIIDYLRDNVSSAIQQEVKAVGHRVVHGGNMTKAAVLDGIVLEEIRKASVLAPLHNPANLTGIAASTSVFPESPQVCVFDTAFHQSMPPKSFMYAIPYHLYNELAIRKYGFHGTSYLYLVQETSRMLQRPPEELNLIICHLGNGASMAAVENGKCIDTTMGLTPLEGLVMGTRSGDIDPAVIPFLMDTCKLSSTEIDTLLNKKSGLMGLCGSNDLRTVLELMDQGQQKSQLAVEVFIHRIRKYIGAYMVHLGGKVDAIVFSAGIGENSSVIRQLACQNLQAFGMEVDTDKNDNLFGGKAGEFQSSNSKVKLIVVPTNEELCIAQQTVEATGIQP